MALAHYFLAFYLLGSATAAEPNICIRKYAELAYKFYYEAKGAANKPEIQTNKFKPIVPPKKVHADHLSATSAHYISQLLRIGTLVR